MKVAWIQDLDPYVYSGGAELNDRRIIQEAPEGVEVQVVVPSLNLDELEAAYDLVVVSNAMGFSPEGYQSLIGRGIPYVVFAHDFGPQVCKYRLLYPMEQRCRSLCYLRERWTPYLHRAAMLIWLSPLHRRAWLWAYPSLRDHPYALVPSSVDPTIFGNLGQPRSGALAVNATVAYKGAANLTGWAEAHPGIPVTLVGGNPENRPFPTNVTVKGRVPYHQMNALYNQHEWFVHLPANVDPFCRTVCEAYLAGCKLVVNSLVGATSWPFFKKGRYAVAKATYQAPQSFWQAVERAAR